MVLDVEVHIIKQRKSFEGFDFETAFAFEHVDRQGLKRFFLGSWLVAGNKQQYYCDRSECQFVHCSYLL